MTSGAPNVSLAFLGVLALAIRSVEPEAVGRGFNPLVSLKWPDRGQGAAWANLRLDEFLADNEETLSLSEVQSICDHLLAGKVYLGGGGADERWTLEVAR